jgi:hypothetical protein
VYDQNGIEILPKTVPTLVDTNNGGEILIDDDLILSKIKNGLEIDNRNKRKCKVKDLDNETKILKDKWDYYFNIYKTKKH